MQKRETKEYLYLVPFDEVSTEVLHRIGEALKEQLPLEYKIMPSEPIPRSAFNPERGQYYSSLLLHLLAEKYANPGRRVLGVVDYDLYVPRLNFVFGEADMINKVAIISLVRLRQERYGLPPDDKLFMRRVLTEAVHELGHTYGLKHCSDPHCVMFFSNSLADTDRKGYHFCKHCLKLLQAQINKEK
ncbi:archaemetzincin family Zn-dependent metalloprotease [Candidatus Sumerlaeota bacterium]|nr:archaemetzincin family Zn-dependent metalloprotease [Candidatus Sumerlaeota bacterium]